MSQPALVPAPARLVVADSAPFLLTSDVAILAETEAATPAAALRRLIEVRTGIPLTSTAAAGVASGRSIRLALGHDGPAESYRLRSGESAVEVVGADAAGLFYGVQTLVQAISVGPAGAHVAAMEIDDAPRFAYRGVMLDVARHFLDVETVCGYIDRAAGLKFNALHLHLTDDQGWRLQLESRPLLTQKAATTAVGGDAGGFYTHDDYRAIVAYATARHMIVVPEIDGPSHTHAVSLAYPELCEEPVLSAELEELAQADGSALPVSGTPYEGIGVGFSSLRIRDERTYAFLADVLTELAALTPGPYLHIGGDEALGTDAEDYAHYIERTSRLVLDAGKTPIAWHEAGASPTLAAGTIGQYWGFVSPTDGMDEKTRGFVRRGGQVILSPADAIYLDMKFDPDSPLGLTWAHGVTTVRRAYDWDPARVVDGIGDDDILGVEAPLWGETARTADDMDALAFPRIAAAAEAAWSPALGATPLRSWESFRTRVGGLGPLWAALGIRFTTSPEIDWMPVAAAPARDAGRGEGPLSEAADGGTA
ncbi:MULTISPECIES: family 20 glycosylhydrolase [Microbacterium]|uniref:beta-N-acetylhexosaminidase n=1 Tax=Microbacterium hominis TaxID=162426 RepID=A0A2K9DAD2_9MICO|nr:MULTISPECIES: family 20 glycosylhydrolase [Microbacterium]AUG30540.1 beta-N-acetylhexosaminidase [Microbacterium hominis]